MPDLRRPPKFPPKARGVRPAQFQRLGQRGAEDRKEGERGRARRGWAGGGLMGFMGCSSCGEVCMT